METRPDTSSSLGRFPGQWSFLSHHPQYAQNPRSHPPSSYILQSDRSSVSPLPTGLQYRTINGSRSSLPRSLTIASVGGRSVASTAPSQPVLLRIHSANASTHTNPSPKPMRPIKMTRNNALPAASEFSIQGILAAIQEDVEQDINEISEILGRSRLVLADQHDSHMPPQGEILATSSSLQAVEETSPADEQWPSDDVLIIRDDASLVDASHNESAAYGLLERLQAMPRNDRIHGDCESMPVPPEMRSHTLATTPFNVENHSISSQEPQRMSRNLLQSNARTEITNRSTLAPACEMHLFVQSDGLSAQRRPHSDHEATAAIPQPQFVDMIESDSTNDTNMPGGLSEPSVTDSDITLPTTFRERMQNLLYVSDPTGLRVWLQGQNEDEERERRHNSSNAEGQLRHLLER